MEGGDDTEVVATPLETAEQVCDASVRYLLVSSPSSRGREKRTIVLALRVRSDSVPISQHHLVSHNVVAGKAVTRRVKSVASSEQEAANTAFCLARADNCAAVLLQLSVYIFPLGTGTQTCCLGIRVVLSRVKEAQVDRHSTVDAVAARPVRVSAGAHGKFLASLS